MRNQSACCERRAVRSQKRSFLILLAIVVFSLNGCSDVVESLGTDTNSRVTHQSWGSYNLYQYANGGWNLIVDLGQPVGAVPALGERPVVVVHGLGARIIGTFDGLAQNLLANGATAVFAFEFDSLDPIEKNGAFFGQALDYLTTREANRTFRFVVHSMGCLVVRTQFENGEVYAMEASGNQASLVAGPHEGSPVATALQSGDRSVAQAAVAQLVLNGELLFFNSNGQPVNVTGDEPVFAQLVPGSDFLQQLNSEAAQRHPQFVYRTMAGTQRGLDYQVFAQLIGVFADDGIVNISSANSALIGQDQTVEAPYNHTTVIQEQAPQLVILRQIGLL